MSRPRPGSRAADVSARRRRLVAPLLAAVTALGWASPVTSQEPRTITFRDAIRIALEQNATLLLARSATQMEAVAVAQQRTQFLPDLRISTRGARSYGRSFSSDEGRVIDETAESLNAGLSSSVVLFDGFGNVAALREARLVHEASERDLERARQTVVFSVASNFLSLIERQEQLRVARESLVAQEAQEAEIREYVDAGVRPIADQYQQQASVAGARLALVEASRAWEMAKLDLMQTLQLDARGEYVFEAPVGETPPAPPPYDLPDLLARAMVQRPDLQAQETRRRAAEEGIRAARAGSWPTVSLSAGYTTAFTTAADVAFWDQLDERRGGSLGVGISLPIFDRSVTRSATARAEIQERNARIQLESQRREAGLQVRRAYLDHAAAGEQLRAAEAQVRAAELALEVSEERYDVGAATLVELTQARAVQVQAASALVTARYNLLFQRTLIDYYAGELDPERAAIGGEPGVGGAGRPRAPSAASPGGGARGSQGEGRRRLLSRLPTCGLARKARASPSPRMAP